MTYKMRQLHFYFIIFVFKWVRSNDSNTSHNPFEQTNFVFSFIQHDVIYKIKIPYESLEEAESILLGSSDSKISKFMENRMIVLAQIQLSADDSLEECNEKNIIIKKSKRGHSTLQESLDQYFEDRAWICKFTQDYIDTLGIPGKIYELEDIDSGNILEAESDNYKVLCKIGDQNNITAVILSPKENVVLNETGDRALSTITEKESKKGNIMISKGEVQPREIKKFYFKMKNNKKMKEYEIGYENSVEGKDDDLIDGIDNIIDASMQTIKMINPGLYVVIKIPVDIFRSFKRFFKWIVSKTKRRIRKNKERKAREKDRSRSFLSNLEKFRKNMDKDSQNLSPLDPSKKSDSKEVPVSFPNSPRRKSIIEVYEDIIDDEDDSDDLKPNNEDSEDSEDCEEESATSEDLILNEIPGFKNMTELEQKKAKKRAEFLMKYLDGKSRKNLKEIIRTLEEHPQG